MKRYLIMLLICVSLVANNVEHLCTCLFAICISSLVKCLVKLFAHFLIGLFVSLMLNFKSSLYIVDMFYCQICDLYLLQSIPCLSILLIVSFTEQKFLVLINPICLFFLMYSTFGVMSKNSFPNSRSWRYFLLKVLVLVFYFLHRDVQLFQHHVLKRPSSIIWLLPLCQNSIGPISWVFCSVLLITDAYPSPYHVLITELNKKS